MNSFFTLPADRLKLIASPVFLRRLLLLVLLHLGGFLRTASAGVVHLPQERNDLVFTNTVSRWDEALPLGNGILGALVWGDGKPVKISLDRTDLWDLTPVPEFQRPDYNLETVRRWRREGKHQDLVKLLEDPYNRPAPTRIPAGRIEIDLSAHVTGSSLHLATASASMSGANGVTVHVFVHGLQPIGVIRLRGASPQAVRLVAPPFGGQVQHAAAGGIGAGDLSQLGYPPPHTMEGKNAREFVQQGALGFSFATSLQWRQSAEEWVGVWSIASSSEGADPLARARSRVEAALRETFDSLQKSHADWWSAYWQKSSVTLPNLKLEKQWYLETYKFGAASRRGAPPISLQGPWTADDGQLPPWKGDYHHDLNTQLSYWPCYAGNHTEEGLAYLDWLWATRSNCVAWTRQFFALPGMNVPMTGDLENRQIGGWRQYTHSFTTAAWLAQHFYLHWKYSADREFLQERAWPYLRESAVFVEAATRERDRNGLRKFPLSSSPEIHDNQPAAWFDEMTNYDLALARWLMGATAEVADFLNLKEQAAHWRNVQAEFPQWALNGEGGLLVSPGEPLRRSHRHFSHLMAIHPLGLIDVRDGTDSKRIVDASLRELAQLGTSEWCGYSFAWLGNIKARARDGAGAEKALEIFSDAFTLRNSFHCNGDQSGKGYSSMTYRPFTLEGNFAAAAGIQEMLLQSHHGLVELFPAIPPTWKAASFTTLRAEGAFLVSAELRDGKVSEVQITGEKGGVCRIQSPWNGPELRLDLKPGEKKILTEQPQ